MRHHLYLLRMLAFGLLAAALIVLTGRAIDQSLASHSGGLREKTRQPSWGIGTAIICFTRQSGKVVCRESR